MRRIRDIYSTDAVMSGDIGHLFKNYYVQWWTFLEWEKGNYLKGVYIGRFHQPNPMPGIDEHEPSFILDTQC